MPKQLTDVHKNKTMRVALMFLDCYQQERRGFRNHIVTGGETWNAYITPEIHFTLATYRFSKTETIGSKIMVSAFSGTAKAFYL